MPRYTSKNIRATWNEENLQRAMLSVRNGVSLRKSAAQFGIPKTTLKRCLDSGKMTKLPLGGKPVLGTMEKELVNHILQREKLLFGLTAMDVRKLAFEVPLPCEISRPLFFCLGVHLSMWLD